MEINLRECKIRYFVNDFVEMRYEDENIWLTQGDFAREVQAAFSTVNRCEGGVCYNGYEILKGKRLKVFLKCVDEALKLEIYNSINREL